MRAVVNETRAAITRRGCLQAGVLGLCGVNDVMLSKLRAASNASATPAIERAHRCVFIFLFGGPSHIDLWDPKPGAPAEIRGEFQPIRTSVPGIEICEHLPRTARQMDKLCLVRSMSHRMNVHGPACSEVYSGREYFGPPVTDQASPEDWPSLAAMVTRFGRRESPAPNSVVLPWYTQFVGQDRRIAGQTGGRMGQQFNPFLIEGNPADIDFRVEGLGLPPDVSPERFSKRRTLLRSLRAEAEFSINRSEATELMDGFYHTALGMVGDRAAEEALRLDREPAALRDAYDRTRFGQSLLLARRLIEAGVSLVTVNWDDDHKHDKVSPHWDTHIDNFPKLKDRLCPVFDRGIAAFVADLADRGLLDSTLVVALGEFGRTPRVGAVTQNGMTEKTGRDHWPHAFTAVLAGGGIRGGQVYGATGPTGGYVASNPVTPADLTATVLAHLGIDPSLEYQDEFLQIRQQLCTGRAVRGLG